MTGAPKIAAVDLIASLEPVGRGASMGALGRVYGNGDFDLALTIRTFAVAEGRLHLWVGGGIVWDSDPREEVAESLVSAAPLLEAIGAPLDRRVAGDAGGGRGTLREGDGERAAPAARGSRLRPRRRHARPGGRRRRRGLARGRAAFETLRVYGGRPFRLEEHLRRLVGSAERLGLPVPDVDEIRTLATAALDAAGVEDASLRFSDARRRARDRRRSSSSPRSPTGSRLRVPAVRASCRSRSPPGRAPGCCRARSRSATRPTPPQRPRRGGAAPTMRCSSTSTARCSRPGDEHLVARGGCARDPRARARHPRRRDARCAARARASSVTTSRPARSRSSGSTPQTRPSRRRPCAR